MLGCFVLAPELGSVVLGVTYNNIYELFISNHSAKNINKPNKTRCVYSYFTRVVKKKKGRGEGSALKELGRVRGKSLSSLILMELNCSTPVN